MATAGRPPMHALGTPDDVAPLMNGGFLIADYTEEVVRKVSPSGDITTVAGHDSSSGTGSGDSAEDVELSQPSDVEPLVGEAFLVAVHGGEQVLEIRPDGSVLDFAGTGDGGFAGDGGPAAGAKLDGPHGLSITPDGDVLIADGHNNRVRMVDTNYPPPTAGRGRSQEPRGRRRHGRRTSPSAGRRWSWSPAYGTVKVKRRRGSRWTRLADDQILPVGSLVDAKRGSVLLTSALDEQGSSQTGTFWGGIFQVRQAPSGNGVTDILLRGGLRGCRKGAARARPSAVASRRRRRVRRLWASDDNGRFRTHGRDSVATTRGTLWLTRDGCKGTLTRVKEGASRCAAATAAGSVHRERRRALPRPEGPLIAVRPLVVCAWPLILRPCHRRPGAGRHRDHLDGRRRRLRRLRRRQRAGDAGRSSSTPRACPPLPTAAS